ncbi:hypothetical protein WJX77_006472 [Trebouxia sp. C0004]
MLYPDQVQAASAVFMPHLEAGAVVSLVAMLQPTAESWLTDDDMVDDDMQANGIPESSSCWSMLQMIRRQRLGLDRSSKEAVVRTLSILAVDNEVNQDHIREQYGIPVLVKLLEAMPCDGVTAAAADALTALAISNAANKTAIREAWAVPLLVKLLGPEVDMSVIEKTVDCLWILMTGNEANKVALLTSASGLPCLVHLMENSPDQRVIERAAAVVGSTNRITEVAAKTLANLASESSNRKGIRLAGGVPPLMRLLMDKPSEQGVPLLQTLTMYHQDLQI